MKKIIYIIGILIISSFLQISYAAETVIMTKENTQIMKDFSSIGKYLNYSAKECGEEVNFTENDAILFCQGKIKGIHNYYDSPVYSSNLLPGYVGCNTKLTFDTLAWCVANKHIHSVEWKGSYDGPSYEIGKPQAMHNTCKIPKDLGIQLSSFESTSSYYENLETISNFYVNNLNKYKNSLCSYTIFLDSGEQLINYNGHTKLKKNNHNLTLSGTKTSTSIPSTKYSYAFVFNSPFIYIDNPPKSPLNLILNSGQNLITNDTPTFNSKNSWKLNSDGKNIFYKGKKIPHLFYELQIPSITISRYGKNFGSKTDLIDYLQNSNFFKKLNFSTIEKENALSYILPKIQESNNYYLTLLTQESIDEISKMDINPKPEQLIRKYFAIYPTNNPVKTSGDLVFPKNIKNTGKYIIKDYGEIYIDKSMIVNWH